MDPTTRVWRDGKLEAEGFPLDQVSDYLEQEDCVVWADVCRPDEKAFRAIAEELNLDPFAVEDAVSSHQRPKLDRFPGHEFLSVYALRLDEQDIEVHACQVSVFLLERAIITMRSEEWFEVRRFTDQWDAAPDLLQYGVPALLHAVLDVVVGSQFEVLEGMDDRLESLEELLFDRRPATGEVQRRTFQLRKSLGHMRKTVLPMQDIVSSLLHRDARPKELERYYQDLNNHVLRTTEWAESLRDMVTTVYETNLSLQDAQLNTIMRKLTAWAAIIAIPTAVTGFYGQNVPYPGFGQFWGFVTSTVVTLVLVGTLYVMLRRRGWL